MPTSDSLRALAMQGYGWVGFAISEGEWLEERRRCRALGLDVALVHTVTSIHDIALLLSTRARWPGPHSIIARLKRPYVRDQELLDATQKMLHAVHRRDGAIGVLFTDSALDSYTDWHGNTKAALLEIEADQITSVCPTVGLAQTHFRACIPVLPASISLRADYDWPLTRPHVVGEAQKVNDWDLWPAAHMSSDRYR